MTDRGWTFEETESVPDEARPANGLPPSRNRLGKTTNRKARSSSRSAKRQSTPGGMHQRRNKRARW